MPSPDGSGIDLPRECPCPPPGDEFEEVVVMAWERYLQKKKEKDEEEERKDEENARKGQVTGAGWARARELGQRVRALLFPGRLQRKWGQCTRRSTGKGRRRRTLLRTQAACCRSGRPLFLPSLNKVRFLHRFQEKLGVAEVRVGQTLGNWRELVHGRKGGAVDGYFCTKGGKILDSDTPVELLGLQPQQEAVFQGRLRGGGFSGGGKGVRGGGGNYVQVVGDWTCGNCAQPGCWNTRSSCDRCGAPSYLDQGGCGQSSGGVQGMEGRYQGGLGWGWAGIGSMDPLGEIRHLHLVVTPLKGRWRKREDGTGTRFVGSREVVLGVWV